MLNDGIPFQLCPAGPRGIWGVAIGEEFHVVRVPFLTDDEARTIAMGQLSGHDLGPVIGGHAVRTVVGQQMSGHSDRVIAVTLSGQAMIMSGQSGQLSYDNCPDKMSPAHVVRLSDAVDQLPADRSGRRLTLDGLRSAARRPGFPSPVEHAGQARLYALADLREWRERQVRGDGDGPGAVR
jgi:hypothetical protein